MANIEIYGFAECKYCTGQIVTKVIGLVVVVCLFFRTNDCYICVCVCGVTFLWGCYNLMVWLLYMYLLCC